MNPSPWFPHIKSHTAEGLKARVPQFSGALWCLSLITTRRVSPHSLRSYHDSPLPVRFSSPVLKLKRECQIHRGFHAPHLLLLQPSFGLPATLVWPMIRPSADGRPRTPVQGGRFSPVGHPPSTLDPTWTTQVRSHCSPEKHLTRLHIFFLTNSGKQSLHCSLCNTRFCPTGGSGNFIYTLATDPQETKVARLLSPVVSSPDSDLCMSFWYHMFGSHIGTLHIKQRKQTVDGKADILLWTVSGHQGNRWREGRVLLPRTNKPYQVSLHFLLGFFEGQ